MANSVEKVIPIAESCFTRVFLCINSIITVVTMPAPSAPRNIGSGAEAVSQQKGDRQPGKHAVADRVTHQRHAAEDEVIADQIRTQR